MIVNVEDFNQQWLTWIGLQFFEKKAAKTTESPRGRRFVIS